MSIWMQFLLVCVYLCAFQLVSETLQSEHDEDVYGSCSDFIDLWFMDTVCGCFEVRLNTFCLFLCF